MNDRDRDPLPDPTIADASFLFDEAPAPSPRPAPASPEAQAEAGDAYAIEGPEPDDAPTAPIVPIPPPRPRPASKAGPRPEARKGPASSGVEQVWSRAAEWGPSLAVLGLGIIGAATLLYTTFRLDALFVWFVLALICGGVLLVLAYPIFITLERPVRITPEQALKDYFGALSHRVPHYRRMWLLLATDGRAAPGFGSFAAFKAYWSRKLAGWKARSGGGGPLNPIEVKVIEFKSDKSAGQTEIDATYTVAVVHAGSPAGPVATLRGSARLVRGPDAMWYLDDGTLDG